MKLLFYYLLNFYLDIIQRFDISDDNFILWYILFRYFYNKIAKKLDNEK